MKKLTFAFFILCFSSCQLFEPKPESEKFYCKVNGKAWRPEKSSYSLSSPLSAELKTNGLFIISAFNEVESFSIGIKLKANEPLLIQEYELQNNPTNGSSATYYYDFSLPTRDRLLSKSGKVNITKNENRIISGTFEFTTYSDIKKKNFKITKGQFNDLIY